MNAFQCRLSIVALDLGQLSDLMGIFKAFLNLKISSLIIVNL